MSGIDDNNSKEWRSFSDKDDEYSFDGAASPASNDKGLNDDTTNGNVGSPAPSPPSSPLDAGNSKIGAFHNDSEEEEEEYETSYAKLQKLRRKYGASANNSNSNDVISADAMPAEDTCGEDNTDHNDADDTNVTRNLSEQKKHQRRRRRGGYGSKNNNAASVLESVSGNEGTSTAAMPDDNSVGGASVEDNHVPVDDWDLDNLDIVGEEEKSNLFLDEDMNNGSGEEEDDDATRPYDDRSGGDDFEHDDEEEDDASTARRGRTKKNKAMEKEDSDASGEVEEENNEPAAHEPSNEGTDDAPSSTGTANPTDKEIIALVDKLFQAADLNNMTLGGVLSYVAEHFGFEDKKALGKERKHMIREHLTLLINGKKDDDDDVKKAPKKKASKKKVTRKKEMEEEEDVQFSGDEDLEEEEEGDVGGNDSSSDYEEETSSKRKARKTSRKKKSASIDDGDDSDHSDYSDDSQTKKRSSSSKRRKRRSKGSSKKGKMKDHLRDEAARRRRRQMEEARIRQEEMGHLADDHNGDAAADDKSKVKSEEEKAAAGPQISEQDRQRAIAIAARFDTNREELRVKREEDRVGLIGKLRQRRLECFTSQEFLKETKEEKGLNVVEEKEDGKKADEKDEEQPRAAQAQENNEDNGMIELDDDSDGSDDDSDDDELEITGKMTLDIKTPTNAPVTKPKEKSMFDSLLSNNGKDAVRRPIVVQKKSKPSSNPRMALRLALREKQVKAGNRWLARELGYKTEEDHIRDCNDVEEKKRKQIFLLEKEAVMREEKKIGTGADDDVEEELHFVNSGEASGYDEEDDEMAMARELNQLEEASKSEDMTEDRTDGSSDQNMNTDLQPSDADPSDNNFIAAESNFLNDNNADGQPASTDALESSPGTKTESESDKTVVTPTVSDDVEDTASGSEEKVKESSSDNNRPYADISNVAKSENEDKDDPEEEEESELSFTSNPTEEAAPKKPRNSAWQAMLKKEKEDLAKQKRRQRKGGGLVEGEAEEEEEEEGIVGLEDFGFAVQKKKGDDDEDADDAEVDEDDLEHVVDDVSDGEGDEEAGEAARKRLEAKEEKERHKEIMRRMREGYGGRDRGIASGIGGARGMHRFDVLVGADNRDEAKQLGLLNDDELDSDDEGEAKSKKKDDDEEEDEAALLDKMLKERFLQKQNDDYLEENFSDDDDEEEEDDGSGENKDGEDDEDKEQDRLAKRFAKRARMNRILEAYEGDSQFSRSRLIDEDESTQNDLKAIKTTLSRKRGSVSMGDRNKDTKENSLNDASKRQRGTSVNEEQSNDPDRSRFVMNESSLSVALIANRNAGRKRKTTFLNGKQNTSLLRKSSTCSSKSLSLGHVIFMAGESQTLSRMDSSSNSFLKSIKTTSVSKKSSKQVSRGSSLWSKVCSKNLR